MGVGKTIKLMVGGAVAGATAAAAAARSRNPEAAAKLKSTTDAAKRRLGEIRQQVGPTAQAVGAWIAEGSQSLRNAWGQANSSSSQTASAGSASGQPQQGRVVEPEVKAEGEARPKPASGTVPGSPLEIEGPKSEAAADPTSNAMTGSDPEVGGGKQDWLSDAGIEDPFAQSVLEVGRATLTRDPEQLALDVKGTVRFRLDMAGTGQIQNSEFLGYHNDQLAAIGFDVQLLAEGHQALVGSLNVYVTGEPKPPNLDEITGAFHAEKMTPVSDDELPPKLRGQVAIRKSEIPELPGEQMVEVCGIKQLNGSTCVLNLVASASSVEGRQQIIDDAVKVLAQASFEESAEPMRRADADERSFEDAQLAFAPKVLQAGEATLAQTPERIAWDVGGKVLFLDMGGGALIKSPAFAEHHSDKPPVIKFGVQPLDGRPGLGATLEVLMNGQSHADVRNDFVGDGFSEVPKLRPSLAGNVFVKTYEPAELGIKSAPGKQIVDVRCIREVDGGIAVFRLLALASPNEGKQIFADAMRVIQNARVVAQEPAVPLQGANAPSELTYGDAKLAFQSDDNLVFTAGGARISLTTQGMEGRPPEFMQISESYADRFDGFTFAVKPSDNPTAPLVSVEVMNQRVDPGEPVDLGHVAQMRQTARLFPVKSKLKRENMPGVSELLTWGGKTPAGENLLCVDCIYSGGMVSAQFSGPNVESLQTAADAMLGNLNIATA